MPTGQNPSILSFFTLFSNKNPILSPQPLSKMLLGQNLIVSANLHYAKPRITFFPTYQNSLLTL